jgi:anti-sigma B factor antagonist
MPDPGSIEDMAHPSELVIRRAPEADALVLSLYGELDLDSSPLLERELETLSAAGRDRVVVDLSGLEFMDSTGLQTLLRAHERAVDADLRFSLVRGQPAVHRVFELTRADEIFSFDG